MKEITPFTFAKKFPDLCYDLTEEDVQTLLDALSMQEFEAAEALIAEGTTTDALFLIWDGELNVYMDTPQGEVEVAHIAEGTYIGEISLMDPGLATATVRSDQGCIALYMSRSDLEALWDSNARVASTFLHELSRSVAARIRNADRYLNSIVLSMQTAEADASVINLTESAKNINAKLFQGQEA